MICRNNESTHSILSETQPLWVIIVHICLVSIMIYSTEWIVNYHVKSIITDISEYVFNLIYENAVEFTECSTI